jgi:pyruvate dehydrogenase phosphatase
MLRAASKLLTAPAAAAASIAVYTHTQRRSKPDGLKESMCQMPATYNMQVSMATYNANNPSEDRLFSIGPVSGWSCSAVFDGHGGWNVSEMASKELPSALAKHMTLANTHDEISDAIDATFDEVENSYIESVRKAWEYGFGGVAKVGSCVLLAMKKEDQLVVANLGDCRAVLATEKPQEVAAELGENTINHYATRLTREHNARAPLEALKLRTEHPNEDNIIRCKSGHACYVKGRLQLTRALGDCYLKYADMNAPPDGTRGRHIPAPYTPPYLSHRPDVSHITLDKGDKFVILATDGLWDFLSDQEAVDVVSRCTGAGQERDPHAAAAMLVEAALQKAAEESGMNVDDLKNLAPGSRRRNKHDDTTVVVMYF